MNFALVPVFFLGLTIIAITINSAIRTFVLPRAVNDPIARFVFQSIRKVLDFRLNRMTTYAQKDRLLAMYAPLSLLALPPAWLSLLSLGYTCLFWATGVKDWYQAFLLSGSSILTLGFVKGVTPVHMILSFTAATLGLIFVALLISYLPTMYTAFSRRESAVNQLSVRANTPPSPVEMLLRYHRLGQLNFLSGFWARWETWFVEIEESHTSLAALVFFRSPLPDHSWVNAAGAVMDAAALRLAVLEIPSGDNETQTLFGVQVPDDPQAAITIRAGFIALRRVADLFGVDYPAEPHFPNNPITVSIAEFQEIYDLFKHQGLAVKPDFENAWQDFAGWRVNYDVVLTTLRRITMAPEAPWLTPNLKEVISQITKN